MWPVHGHYLSLRIDLTLITHLLLLIFPRGNSNGPATLGLATTGGSSNLINLYVCIINSADMVIFYIRLINCVYLISGTMFSCRRAYKCACACRQSACVRPSMPAFNCALFSVGVDWRRHPFVTINGVRNEYVNFGTEMAAAFSVCVGGRSSL